VGIGGIEYTGPSQELIVNAVLQEVYGGNSMEEPAPLYITAQFGSVFNGKESL
jgi:hypothetical protein